MPPACVPPSGPRRTPPAGRSRTSCASATPCWPSSPGCAASWRACCRARRRGSRCRPRRAVRSGARWAPGSRCRAPRSCSSRRPRPSRWRSAEDRGDQRPVRFPTASTESPGEPDDSAADHAAPPVPAEQTRLAEQTILMEPLTDEPAPEAVPVESTQAVAPQAGGAAAHDQDADDSAAGSRRGADSGRAGLARPLRLKDRGDPRGAQPAIRLSCADANGAIPSATYSRSST